MEVAEEIYQQLRSPVEMPALSQAIEEIQAQCRRRGVRYPRILLRRKIELIKGDYIPQRPEAGPMAFPRAFVQCVACGAEFQSLRQLSAEKLHPCDEVARVIWRQVKQDGQRAQARSAERAGDRRDQEKAG